MIITPAIARSKISMVGLRHAKNVDIGEVMKKLVTIGLLNHLVLSAALPAFVGVSASNVHAQEAKSDATSIDLAFDASEIQTLLNKIGETTLSEGDQAFIDSIVKNPIDKSALEGAQQLIEKRLQWSMHELSELKKIALRYMIVGSQVKSPQYLKLIAKEHTERAQNHYNRAMWSLAGAYNDLPKVLSQCATELCAIQITEAFKELRLFVENANKDIEFEHAKSSVELFWKFENPILKTSLGKTFRKMIPNNEDHNAWKAAGAALLAPLSFAGQVVYSYGKAAGTAVLNPRYLNIEFSVDEVRIDYDLIDDELENAVTHRIQGIFGEPLRATLKSEYERNQGRAISEESLDQIVEFIRSTVGDYSYVPSTGMIEVAGRYFGVPVNNETKVGQCSIDFYNGAIRGRISFDYRYSDYHNLQETTIDLVKRIYNGKCDR